MIITTILASISIILSVSTILYMCKIKKYSGYNADKMRCHFYNLEEFVMNFYQQFKEHCNKYN